MNWEDKIWGRVCHLFDKNVSVSLLEVNRGFRCSTHFHKKRWNSFKVISGKLLIRVYGDDNRTEIMTETLGPGQSFDVPKGMTHRFEVLESGRVVEIYWTLDGSDVDIKDIVRFDEGGRI